jgi:hypothetical protein
MTVKSTNFGDFTEAGEALDLYGNAIRKSIATDVYKNKNTFSVVVLTKPLPISENGITVSGFKFKGRILDPETIKLRNGKTRLMGPPSPHRFLPDPCNLSTAAMKAQAIKIIGLHTEFSGPAEGAIPNPGDIVTVVLEPGDYSYNVARATFTKLVVKSANRSQSLQGVPGTSPSCTIKGMESLFEDGAADLGTNIGESFNSLAANAPVVTGEQVVMGDNLTLLTSIVERELGFWSGKVETDSAAYDKLKVYWDNLGWPEQQVATSDWFWTPSGTAWSAAFISYIVGRVDRSFPKSASHFKYSKSALSGKGRWSMWSLGTGKIKAQVGDILVKAAPERGPTASHGDVVYKIENNKVFLAGGNLGQTAKKAAEFNITPEGYYSFTADYVIVLKKNGRISNSQVA